MIFFLPTNWSKVERLTIGDGSFGIFRVAIIYVKVLVSACGLDMQVSPDLAVLQFDPCVEDDLFGRPVGSKFDSRVVTVQAVNEHS